MGNVTYALRTIRDRIQLRDFNCSPGRLGEDVFFSDNQAIKAAENITANVKRIAILNQTSVDVGREKTTRSFAPVSYKKKRLNAEKKNTDKRRFSICALMAAFKKTENKMKNQYHFMGHHG